MGALAVGFAAIGGPILLLIGFMPAIVSGVVLMTGAFAGLSIAMGPITLVILGIAAAIAAGSIVWKNWDRIMSVLRSPVAWLLMRNMKSTVGCAFVVEFWTMSQFLQM